MLSGMWQLEVKTLGLSGSPTAFQLIAEIDEFKGKWEALRTLSPERLLALRHVATVESVASSTHISQLHTVMLKYSDKDEHPRGHYKKLSNNVIAYDAEGRFGD
jgi:hypothetical protein